MSGSPQAEVIQKMFSQVAARYDLANDVLSLGIHHLWRKKLVTWSGAQPGSAVLDCATGTGDLAIEFKRVVGAGRVVGTDFCADMLETAPRKAKTRGLEIEFTVADVMNLAYENDSFDISSISFGIRNVSDPLCALKELARVTKPGGVVMVLEFGPMKTPILGSVFNFYSQKILPQLGGWLTGQKEAYSYLQKSSAAFPAREDFLSLMNQTQAFTKTEYKSLSGGVAYMYRGVVGLHSNLSSPS